jgi:oligopeptide/dipeptide ABC transporter ATP-binding protein
MSDGAILEIADLHVRAGDAHILRGVSLSIGRGRIVGIVGESGSGKSTLALCLLRLLAPDMRISGRVMLDNQDVLALPDAALRHVRGATVAMVFQDPMSALNPVFTIGTQLVDVLRNRWPRISRGEARRRAVAMLVRVGIADAAARLDQYPHALSGGLRQRVMIAMALLVEPALLVADEPTTALDATVEAQVAALFADLRRDFQGSVLFISHQLGLVAGLCDDVCVMYAGTICETGPAEAVFTHPRHPYTAALLACEPSAGEGRLQAIAGEVPTPRAHLPGCGFAPRCGYAEPRCHTQVPLLRLLGEHRSAACHFPLPAVTFHE